MLLMAGNVQSNPGPEPECLYVPSEFSSRPGLKIVYLNVRSLMPKIYYIRIWTMSSKTDIIAISETWLKKTLSDNDIAIDGYNIFCVDRKSKGGGVVIYVNCRLNASLIKSMTVPKYFEMLAIELTLGNTRLTVACCYIPPSANKEALSILSTALADIVHEKEIILLGDLNWNWLTDVRGGK